MERLKTYIDGFDDVLEGGIPAGNVVLLTGKPGTMKTTVSYNILHHNAKEEEKVGVYITLEQSKRSLLRDLENAGYAYAPLSGKVNLQDFAWIRKALLEEEGDANARWIDDFKHYLNRLNDQLKMDIIVIDSIPVVEVLAKFEDAREEWFHLMEFFRDQLRCTTILIAEVNPQFADENVAFLADGIIELDLAQTSEISTQLRIRCRKMRGTSHNRDYHQLGFAGPGKLEATQIFTDSL